MLADNVPVMVTVMMTTMIVVSKPEMCTTDEKGQKAIKNFCWVGLEFHGQRNNNRAGTGMLNYHASRRQ